MAAPEQVLELVEKFQANYAEYKAPRYNEASTRQEFVNPLFRALGWDMDNTEGRSLAQREVVHEYGIHVEGKPKSPDYCFLTGSKPKFFVEVKKPSVNLAKDNSPAFQLRRYGWSQRLPINLLTDFEEFAVYDCRIEPHKDDIPQVAQLKYFLFTEYEKNWDEIYEKFSREAVLGGALDSYIDSLKDVKGASTVDAAFLRAISGWRDILAREVAARNPSLSQRDLNFAVQMTLDRLVFLRICEDRGIERPYGKLKEQLEGTGIYGRLLTVFQQADAKYNSGLFHFADERGREEAPDELTPQLVIGDEPLRQIIGNLYYPESPYEFSVIPVEILGQVYEQFLGKVIQLGPNQVAHVEDKPEVRKAGGVFYTPAYIVEYIVKNTVGNLLEGKTPDDAAKLRVVDPSCGSGSFLIGAYQYLMDWHRDWYVQDGAAKHAKIKRGEKAARLFEGQGGIWQLTTQERKRILLNNIYGVDIDPQAVEVTKLSLLLKVLEGEASAAIDTQLSFLQERALPDLDNNIKCGNSLIGPEFYSQQQMKFFTLEEEIRINVFDWKTAFPAVFQAGGFDAVIGNPPYIRVQALNEWAPIEVEHYKKAYQSASKGNYDIYVVFVERGLSLLNPSGRLGFILPHKFFNAQYGQPLRQLLAQGKHLSKIIHFGDKQVFANATTYTALLFLDKTAREQLHFVKVDDLANWRTTGQALEGDIPASSIAAAEWNFTIGKNVGLFDKLRAMPVRLKDVAHIFVGTQTSADDVFVLNDCKLFDDYVIGISKSLDKEVKVEAACTKPFLRGKEIRRYEPMGAAARLICPYEITAVSSRLLTQEEMSSKFPLALAYLEDNKEMLSAREKGKLNGPNWYAFGYPKSMTLFQKPKIIVPDYNNIASFTFDKDEHFYKTGYGILVKDASLSPMYVLGLLNSPLLFKYLLSIGTSLRGGYIRFWTQFIEQLPIRAINFEDAADRKRHEQMVALVEVMLDLHKRLAAARTNQDKNIIKARIAATDKQIDELVYELYELTEEERKIVEG